MTSARDDATDLIVVVVLVVKFKAPCDEIDFL